MIKTITLTLKEFISSHIDFLNEQIEVVQQEINELTAQSEMREKVNLLTSIPGIGQQTALMILTLLPEIASSENKSLAALVGVAPFNRDSGKFRGKRFIQGGRKTLRKALYMAAVAAVRWNKPLADFYHRLRAKGKCRKVAIVAVMHKLVAIVSSVYKRKSPWVENLA
ncbi:transposase [Candidatus Regiella insecticola]|uniref:transposase n=1 Tax=Candidatus Regiella insecticola TaxID=138073 RepID=UPI0012FEA4E6|nr:transposase [Candidatus Regiella insecticola]